MVIKRLMRSLLAFSGHFRGIQKKSHFALISSMYICSTMHSSLQWLFYSKAINDNEDTDGVQLIMGLTHLAPWLEATGDAFFCLNIFLADWLFVSSSNILHYTLSCRQIAPRSGDAGLSGSADGLSSHYRFVLRLQEQASDLLAYRNRSHLNQADIIVLAGIIVNDQVVGLESNVTYVVVQKTKQFVTLSSAYFALSISTSLATTLLITLRILLVQRAARRIGVKTSSYSAVIEILVESAALYSATLLVFVILNSRHNVNFYFAQNIHAQVAVRALCFILCIANGLFCYAGSCSHVNRSARSCWEITKRRRMEHKRQCGVDPFRQSIHNLA